MKWIIIALIIILPVIAFTQPVEPSRVFVYNNGRWIAPPKDPSAILDYTINWAPWLNGDVVVSSTWRTDSGITVQTSNSTPTLASVWLTGGTSGYSYKITNVITTSGGRLNEKSFVLPVQVQ